jgi:hypothetical protein
VPFKKGQGGRPKGAQNKATREMKEWAANLFQSPAWQGSARKRIIAGKAPHLEAHVLQVLMPKTDRIAGPNGEPILTRVVNTYTEDHAEPR